MKMKLNNKEIDINYSTEMFLINFYSCKKIIKNLEKTKFQMKLFNNLSKKPLYTLNYITNNFFLNKNDKINLKEIDIKILINSINQYIGLY